MTVEGVRKKAGSGKPKPGGGDKDSDDDKDPGGSPAGRVIVTVVCEEQAYTAGVTDTVAVANAVLTPEQLQLVQSGETVEIRIDVTDISENVPPQDREVIEDAVAAYREELPGHTR